MEKASFDNTTPFKIVSLIAAVVTIMACFVGAVTWVNMNMANNAVSIQSLEKRLLRHEVLITKNSEVLNQHAQVLAIIHEQGKAINVLTDFMTQGGRFTEMDGAKLHEELNVVKERLHHYEVLETELSWIKKSITRMEFDIARRFEGLHKKLDVSGKNDGR